jgi:type II secretory pathway pseudopilin PulG
MKLKHRIPLLRAKASPGFTLVELLVSATISVFVVGSIAMLCIISMQNFAATSNYVQMNDQSRNAVDRISREVRNATALIAYSTNNPQYLVLTNANKGTYSIITCDTSASMGTLVLSITGVPDATLLTGCTNFSFQLFNRAPVIGTTNLSFGSITNIKTGQPDPNFCKVINLNWACKRTILGSKLNTEVVQTAQVVLRNQVSQ